MTKRERGFIYVITNHADPGVVKVGYSDDTDRRLGQFNRASNTVGRWVLHRRFTVLKSDMRQAEAEAHKALASYRVGKRKEQFRLNAEAASEIVGEALLRWETRAADVAGEAEYFDLNDWPEKDPRIPPENPTFKASKDDWKKLLPKRQIRESEPPKEAWVSPNWDEDKSNQLWLKSPRNRGIVAIFAIVALVGVMFFSVEDFNGTSNEDGQALTEYETTIRQIVSRALRAAF